MDWFNSMMDIYHPLDKALQQAGSLMNAAETHGILCGLLCSSTVTDDDDIAYLMRHVLGEGAHRNALTDECYRLLSALRHYTLDQLNAEDFCFMPLLPNDDYSLAERVQGLGGWCEGFLFGLGLAGTKMDLKQLPADSREFLQDLLAFSRIAPQSSEDNADEHAYMQVLEYLRVGVLTLYEKIAQQKTNEHEVYNG